MGHAGHWPCPEGGLGQESESSRWELRKGLPPALATSTCCVRGFGGWLGLFPRGQAPSAEHLMVSLLSVFWAPSLQQKRAEPLLSWEKDVPPCTVQLRPRGPTLHPHTITHSSLQTQPAARRRHPLGLAVVLLATSFSDRPSHLLSCYATLFSFSFWPVNMPR